MMLTSRQLKLTAKYGLLLFFYFLLSIFTVYSPKVLNFNNEIFHSGDASWFVFNAFSFFNDFSFRDFLEPSKSFFYPDRNMYFYDGGIFYSLAYGFVYFLSRNYIFSYNILIPLFIALASLSSFYVVNRLVQDERIAFIAGLIYGHHSVALSLWWNVNLLSAYSLLPLLIHRSLLVVLCPDSTKNKALFALSFALVGYASVQISIFSFMVFLLMAVVWFRFDDFKSAYKYTLHCLISLCAALLLQLPLIIYHMYFQIRYASVRPLEGIINSSLHIASPWWFIAPACEGYLYKWISKITTHLSCSDGSVLWIGLVGFCLISYLLFSLITRRGTIHKSVGRLFLLYFLIFSFSFGPYFDHNGNYYLAPYSILYFNIPGFDSMRVPARILYFNNFLLAILVGYSLKHIVDSWRDGTGFTILVMVIFVFHLIDASPHKSPAFFKVTAFDSPVWSELKKEKYNAVIKFPIRFYSSPFGLEIDDAEEFYEQMIYRKPTPYGYEGFMSWSSARLLEFLASSRKLSSEKLYVLSSLGVDTIVIDKESLTREDYQESLNNLNLTYSDHRYEVYSISTYTDEQFSKINNSVNFAAECVYTGETLPDKRVSIIYRLFNKSNSFFVQKSFQAKALVRIKKTNGDATANVWVQLPLIVPSLASAEGVFVVPREFLRSAQKLVLEPFQSASIKFPSCALNLKYLF